MGYIVAPEKLMAEFRKIYQYVGFSAHSPSQYALAEYMKNDTWCAALPQFFTEKRDFFRHLLKIADLSYYLAMEAIFKR